MSTINDLKNIKKQKPCLSRNSKEFIAIKIEYEQLEDFYDNGILNFESETLEGDLETLRQSAKKLDEAIKSLESSFDYSDVKADIQEIKRGVTQALTMTQGGLR